MYVTAKEAKLALGVCTKTLQNYDKQGKIEVIRTVGDRRRYNLRKYLEENNLEAINNLNRKKILYCRVSSYDRKDDLDRQIKYLQNLYKDYEIISDIGSGINFKRKGLQKILDYAIKNELEEVVITYKDRLCRIGYELIEHIITTYSKGKITIVHEIKDDRNDEITKDLIEIITVYSSKIHGTRSNKIEKNS